MPDLIAVLVVSPPESFDTSHVLSRDLGKSAARAFNIRVIKNDSNLARELVEHRPQVIVSFGQPQQHQHLWNASLDVRKRWVSYAGSQPSPEQIAADIMQTFVRNATSTHLPETPLVSVFTPTYLTGDKLSRPYRSLIEQSYSNWEWVVFDDSPDSGTTFGQVVRLAESDPRVSAYRAGRCSGVIGEVKRRACGLARGSILVELDHDDALTKDALGDIVRAFHLFPEAGFAYTDCAEVSETGVNLTYGPTFAFGFGSYRAEPYGGREYSVTNYPGINAKTIRHIVGVPNHARAWRRETYQEIGGYSPDVHVCDDYEILLRTFLATRMVHIRRFGYIQYHGEGTNTQRKRNLEIQRLVEFFRCRYEDQIHARLLELGVPDFVRSDRGLDWTATAPPGVEVNANLVYQP
jgi:glycosyltransferase involved in cell wall biosynthesis